MNYLTTAYSGLFERQYQYRRGYPLALRKGLLPLRSIRSSIVARRLPLPANSFHRRGFFQ